MLWGLEVLFCLPVTEQSPSKTQEALISVSGSAGATYAAHCALCFDCPLHFVLLMLSQVFISRS